MTTSTENHLARFLDLKTVVDERGALGVVQNSDLPFDIQRIYFLHDVPPGFSRGAHGHKRLQQCFVSIGGTVDVTIDDGERRQTFPLSSPSRGLYVPAMRWRDLTGFSHGAVVLVLASAPYDADDYVHDYESFRALARAERGRA